MVKPQHLVKLAHAGGKLPHRKIADHLAVVHEVEAIGDTARKPEILLHQNHGHAAALQLLQNLSNALYDDGGKPFGRLIQQQHLDAGAQDARHGQHLLLATGELRAGAGAAFVKIGKQLVDFIERHAAGGDDGRQHQILLDTQCREDAALLRHETEAAFCGAMQRHRH